MIIFLILIGAIIVWGLRSTTDDGQGHAERGILALCLMPVWALLFFLWI